MSAHEAINNHELILAIFGQWPSFHDGEVHRIVLDRTRRLPSGLCCPTVELFVRGWIMSSEVTDAGYYKTEHDSVVHFLFEQVTELELDGLNHQNVLSALDFELISDTASNQQLISVELCHCYGLSGGFKARRATVVSVSPYVRDADIYAG